jgi:hypothetical protein
MLATLRFLVLFILQTVLISPRTVIAAEVQKCDVNSLPTTAEQLENPGQEPIAYLFAEGVRIYNCTSGTPSLTSGGLVNITNGGLLSSQNTQSTWTGVGYYPDSEGNGTFALTETNPKTGSTTGSEFFLTLDYSTVQFIPAPDGQSLDWARWDVFTVPRTLQQELNIGWASRFNTSGGAEPKDCSIVFVNNSVVVDYTAYYFFYPCPPISSTNNSSSSSSSSNSTVVPPEQEEAESELETSVGSLLVAWAPCLLSLVVSLVVIV